MAHFSGALVLLSSFCLLMSQSSGQTVTSTTCLRSLCSLGMRPDPTSCSKYFKCSSPIMDLLAAFRQWNNWNWSQDWNITACTLKGSWVTSFQTSNIANLNKIFTGLGMGKIKRMKRDTLTTLISSLASGTGSISSSSGSISLVTNLGPSVSCSCKNCYFDDLYRDCRYGEQLNPIRQKACGVTTTTPEPVPTTPSKPPTSGVGLTAPPPATTTTTTASGGIAVGAPCGETTTDMYGEPVSSGCQSCTAEFVCTNGKYTTKTCPTGTVCPQSSGSCGSGGGVCS